MCGTLPPQTDQTDQFNLTLCGSCIVINLCDKIQRDALYDMNINTYIQERQIEMHFICKFIPINILYMFRID